MRGGTRVPGCFGGLNPEEKTCLIKISVSNYQQNCQAFLRRLKHWEDIWVRLSTGTWQIIACWIKTKQKTKKETLWFRYKSKNKKQGCSNSNDAGGKWLAVKKVA